MPAPPEDIGVTRQAFQCDPRAQLARASQLAVAVTLNKPLDFEQGGQFFRAIILHVVTRNHRRRGRPARPCLQPCTSEYSKLWILPGCLHERMQLSSCACTLVFVAACGYKYLSYHMHVSLTELPNAC
jgi:hypothetical protein